LEADVFVVLVGATAVDATAVDATAVDDDGDSDLVLNGATTGSVDEVEGGSLDAAVDDVEDALLVVGTIDVVFDDSGVAVLLALLEGVLLALELVVQKPNGWSDPGPWIMGHPFGQDR